MTKLATRKRRSARGATARRYEEGTWFAVPLLRGGFGVGLVARIGTGGLILGYFFGPARKSVPRLEDLTGFKPRQAVLVQRFDDLYLRQGKWPIVAMAPTWEKSEWPLPAFGFLQPLTGIPLRREYAESNVEVMVSEVPLTVGELDRLPEDGQCGAGAVEILLSRALGQRLGVPSSEDSVTVVGKLRSEPAHKTRRTRKTRKPVRAGTRWTYVTVAVPSKADKERVYELEEALEDEGVTFDASWDYQTHSREWTLDWSFEGPLSRGDVIERLRKSGLEFTVKFRASSG